MLHFAEWRRTMDALAVQRRLPCARRHWTVVVLDCTGWFTLYCAKLRWAAWTALGYIALELSKYAKRAAPDDGCASWTTPCWAGLCCASWTALRGLDWTGWIAWDYVVLDCTTLVVLCCADWTARARLSESMMCWTTLADCVGWTALH